MPSSRLLCAMRCITSYSEFLPNSHSHGGLFEFDERGSFSEGGKHPWALDLNLPGLEIILIAFPQAQHSFPQGHHGPQGGVHRGRRRRAPTCRFLSFISFRYISYLYLTRNNGKLYNVFFVFFFGFQYMCTIGGDLEPKDLSSEH